MEPKGPWAALSRRLAASDDAGGGGKVERRPKERE